MPSSPTNSRSRVRRLPNRAAYDRETIDEIVDGALICHLGFVVDGQPFVIPTIHARIGDTLYLHGSSASRMMRHGAAGHPLCATITELNGIVLARSIFHHSMNYRSAVLFGRSRVVDDPAEKLAALEAFSEKLIPGRWADVRQPNELELKATLVVAMPIEDASAKIRTGPPGDEAADYELPVWAGVLPIHELFGELEADPRLAPGIEPPGYLAAYREAKNRRSAAGDTP